MPTLAEMLGISIDQQAPSDKVPPSPAPKTPPGMQQMLDALESFLPGIEQITGLNRKDLTLQLIKAGIKGGSLDSVLGNLMGKPPAPEARFVRTVKTLAIWVPVAMFLLGISVVGVYAFLKLMVIMLGSL